MVHKVTDPPVGKGNWFEEHSLFVRYLIVRHSHHQMEVLISPVGSRAALPVFSAKHKASNFLRFGAFGPEWHVRESTAGELISLLMGHIADVEYVVLDPPSGLAASEEVSPERLSKKTFIGSLMKEPMLMSPR